MVPLLAGSNWGNGVWVEGFEVGPRHGQRTRASTRSAPGYFRTLGIPLLAGREFTPGRRRRRAEGRDRQRGVRQEVQPRAGTRSASAWDRASGEKLDIEIVGLVQDAKYSEVKDAIPPLFFVPYRQDKDGRLDDLLRAHVARRRQRCSARVPARGRAPRSEPAGREPADDAASRCGRTSSSIGSSACCRRRSPSWRRCSRRSASTACSPTRSRSGRARSACAWRSAPAPARVRRMVLRQTGLMTARRRRRSAWSRRRGPRPRRAVAAVRAEGVRPVGAGVAAAVLLGVVAMARGLPARRTARRRSTRSGRCDTNSARIFGPFLDFAISRFADSSSWRRARSKNRPRSQRPQIEESHNREMA